MKKYIFTIIFAICALSSVHSQSVNDLVRYSQRSYYGSARTMGVGSAFGAMGGDYSVIVINPAGLGEFKKSEFVFSIGHHKTQNSSLLKGVGNKTETRDQSKTNLDQIGYVGAANFSGSSFLNSNFAIGYNKLFDFDGDISYSGSSKGSITDALLGFAGNKHPDDLSNYDTGIAYETGAIFIDEATKQYNHDYRKEDVVDKAQTITRSGRLSEINVAWGGNIKNKLNVGLTLGFPIGSFVQRKNYTQDLVDSAFSNRLKFTEELKADLAGINLKIGAIYKPVKMLRLGLALHTPTAMSVSENFSSAMDYSYETPRENHSSTKSFEGSFDYAIVQPWRAVVSAGSLFKFGDIYGFADIDYEYVGYGNSSFNLTTASDNASDAEYERELNNQVDKDLRSVGNVRFGTELAYKYLRIRGGYGFLPSPYNNSSESTSEFSLGAGVNTGRFFFDVAYRKSSRKEIFNPYYHESLSQVPVVDIDENVGKISFTAGIRF